MAKKLAHLDELVSMSEICSTLRCSRPTSYKLINAPIGDDDHLPTLKIGRRRFATRRHLQQLIERKLAGRR